MYTIADIAQMTGRNRETVRRWIRKGKLKAIRYTGKRGETIQISEEDWEEFNRNRLIDRYFELNEKINELTKKMDELLLALGKTYNKEGDPDAKTY